jgi:hypothetical protein
MVRIIAIFALLQTLLATASQVSFNPAKLDRCTTMITGKTAGKHGPMTTHTADCLDCDFRASKVPAQDHAPGATRNCYLYKGDYPQSVMTDRGTGWLPSNIEGTEEQKKAWGTISEVVMTIPEVSIVFIC